jgi:hypothetical protein
MATRSIHASSLGQYRAAADQSHQPTLRLRMQVRMHRGSLDQMIAQGVGIVPSPALALRLDQLSDPRIRQRAAKSLRGAIVAARRQVHPTLNPAVPVARRAINECSGAIEYVAEMLEGPGEVDPRGVARAFELITDGSGPLYGGNPNRTLASALWWVADGLKPDVI